MTRRAFVLAAAAVAVASVGTRAANWPQWRGPGGQGISDEQQIPLEWSSTRNVAWKTLVAGQGHSQPIVWDNRVFLTSEIEGAPAVGHKAPEHRIEGEIFKHPDSVGSDKQHRLNVLAAFFFPIATLMAIFGTNLQHGLETLSPPIPFLIVLGIGFLAGCIMTGFIKRRSKK